MCCPSAPPVPSLFFSFITRRPPRSPLFPYTTLFRSHTAGLVVQPDDLGHQGAIRHGPGARGPGQPAIEPTTTHVQHRSEEHTSELQSRENLVCRLLLEKKKNTCIIQRCCQAKVPRSA